MSKLVNMAARNPTGVARFEYFTELRQGEPDLKSPSDNEHPLQRIGRITSVTGLCSRSLWQNADPFIMSNRIWTYACCLSQSAGSERVGTVIFHNEEYEPWNAFTFIRCAAREKPALYEVKDGKPNLISFQLENGVYVVPKILDSGYLAKAVAFLPLPFG